MGGWTKNNAKTHVLTYMETRSQTWVVMCVQEVKKDKIMDGKEIFTMLTNRHAP